MTEDTIDKPGSRERDLIARARQQAADVATPAAPPHSDETVAHTPDTPATRPAGNGTTAARAPRPAPPTPTFPGYEVRGELSRGGQGVVYRALQAGTKREVAIKVLLEGVHASESTRRRFEREIELAAQLSHPNIITIFHSGVTTEGLYYYVMDFVKGTPLHRFTRDRQLPLEETLALFAQVADAVQYAHQRGIIHRDLKPSNIIVDAAGQPRILDFGLAKLLTQDEGQALTMTEEVMGTLPYMSPEQTRGKPSEIDTRSDIYALGVILYELLTGRYPYPVVGALVDVLRNITEAAPTPPTQSWNTDTGIRTRTRGRPRKFACPIDDEVQTMVLRALAKERERRYQSAGEFARDVRNYLIGAPIEAKRDSALYVLRKLALRYWYVSAPVAASVVILIGMLGIVGFSLATTKKALAGEKAAKEQAVERLNEVSIMNKQVMPAVRAAMLGWFLLEWSNDRLVNAENLRRPLRKNAPEWVCTEFLLGDNVTPEALLKSVPPDLSWLAHFVIGEKLLKAGNNQAALAEYDTALAEQPGDWMRAIVKGRVDALRRAPDAAENKAP